MARKSASDLLSAQKGAQRVRQAPWTAVGIDTSLSSLAIVAVSYDPILNATGVGFASRRWLSDDHYFRRLLDCARGYELVLDALPGTWTHEPADIYIAIEEPWYYGATKRQESSFLKQQAEISGAFKSSLLKWGFENIFEINNAQWKAVIRHEGDPIRPMPEGKWDVKEWAIRAYGLPNLPDLVKSKTGSKIPRPESGYGAKAQAVQPDDIYDAAACAGWMQNYLDINDLK